MDATICSDEISAASNRLHAGVDGTVVFVNQGMEGSLDTTKMNQPIVGFVVGQRGLMAGATVEGAKFTKLKR